MNTRQPYWCVVEISSDGVRTPISPAFKYVDEAEKRKEKMLKEESYRGKNLQVLKAAYPVDPRKRPPRRR